MLKTLDLQIPLLFSHRSVLFDHHIAEANASLQTTHFAPRPRGFASHLSRSHRIQIQNPIVSARRRRTRQARSQSSTRFLLNLASLVASNLKVLPRPLDLVLEEIAAGDGNSGCGGGNLGFWRGFGWGDFDGWGRGRRRRAKWRSKLWLCGFAAICGLGLLFGREIEGNAIWWALGFGPLGIALVRWWEKSGGVQGWVLLGFCLWSFVVGLSFGREELQKWVSRVRVSLPMVGTLGGPTRRRRRRRSSGRVF